MITDPDTDHARTAEEYLTKAADPATLTHGFEAITAYATAALAHATLATLATFQETKR